MSDFKNMTEGLRLRDRVIKLMESDEDFGGPQSVDDLCRNLGISNGSARSVLVKLSKAGKIERISKGIYQLPGESRRYHKNKPHIGS
ncbi:MAG: hypothetical protein FJ356_02930 [Thaumarchaeota archaeon]|nr:hypothetical protein [Nitrososphaerota archaeon]